MVDIERVWVDFETTGLDPRREAPLELGLMLTDRWGGIIAEKSWLIWDDEYFGDYKRDSIDFVKEMHDKSGLWKDLESEPTFLLHEVENLAMDWFDEQGVQHSKFPMCGNNVPFDRGFMQVWLPKLEEGFHYRNIDVSTVKELCRDLNPEVFAKAPTKNEKHRVLPDLVESINEYKFYVENFIWTV